MEWWKFEVAMRMMGLTLTFTTIYKNNFVEDQKPTKYSHPT
tara:strand:- start:2753 stop:2875 length:123 start_codon:yes stop_codon:yes gene_type:complete